MGFSGWVSEWIGEFGARVREKKKIGGGRR